MFKKATKYGSKLRLAIAAPSGSGKTYSALRIATGIGGKIAFIDTEHMSASKYADKFDFDTLDLSEDQSVKTLIKAINSASEAGYTTCIVDSLSHAWDSLLEQIDLLAKTKYQGNSFRAWSEGTPEQKKLINAILSSKCHMICCMRVKSEYLVDKDERTGRQKITRVGLAPRQREGMEYEFDMLMEGTVDHFFTVSKDRSGKFQDMIIEKPSESFGAELNKWLTGDLPNPPQTLDMVKKLRDEINVYVADNGVTKDMFTGLLKKKYAEMNEQELIDFYELLKNEVKK